MTWVGSFVYTPSLKLWLMTTSWVAEYFGFGLKTWRDHGFISGHVGLPLGVQARYIQLTARQARAKPCLTIIPTPLDDCEDIA